MSLRQTKVVNPSDNINYSTLKLVYLIPPDGIKREITA